MTIYGLYTRNGNRAGFWVQHRSWKNTCAQVQSIADRHAGPLPGSSPLHDGAAVKLLGFDVRSGRAIALEDSLADPADRNFDEIAEPAWSHPALREPTWCFRQEREVR